MVNGTKLLLIQIRHVTKEVTSSKDWLRSAEKQISERPAIPYRDWFPHLDPTKIQMQEPITIKNHQAPTDLLSLLNAANHSKATFVQQYVQQ